MAVFLEFDAMWRKLRSTLKISIYPTILLDFKIEFKCKKGHFEKAFLVLLSNSINLIFRKRKPLYEDLWSVRDK